MSESNLITKICRTCNFAKLLDEFHAHKETKDGRNTSCKQCSNARSKKWREENREKFLGSIKKWTVENKEYKKQSDKNYYKNNKEKVLEINKKWKKDNKEKYKKLIKNWYEKNKKHCSLSSMEWRKANPEKAKLIYKNWIKNNPGKVNFYSSSRRSKKLMATPAWANLSKIKEIYVQAQLLRKQGFDVNVDHIVPLVSKQVCGLHVEWNLQIIDATANRKKSNKLDVLI